MLENRLPGKIYGSKIEKEIGDMRAMRSEELHNLHFSPHVIRDQNNRMRVAGHEKRMGRRDVHPELW